jgi:hypothetical protein
MQSQIQILVTDPLPVRKSKELASDDSADGYALPFDPYYSEYDLMANTQYNETQYSQELKLVTSRVANICMPYRCHV